MSPPSPPLPPSGPPRGLYFSRCTEDTPWPPLPAATCTVTRSTKAAMSAAPYLLSAASARANRPVRSSAERVVCSGLDGCDGDGLASPPRAEGDRAGVEREQRVVAPATDTQTRVEVGPALAHDDLAGLDDLAAEALHAEALGVRVAAVAGRRSALLVCHVFVSPSRCRGPRRWSGADGAPAACGSRSCS